MSERLLELKTFDAVVDLAQDLPVHVIMDLIGWPEQGRDQLLKLAQGSFNAAGPKNERMYASLPQLEEMYHYLNEVATPENLRPGNFGANLYQAADRGDLPR